MPTTFDDVMRFHPGNRNVYEDIRDSLGQLLPFVGAGLTTPVYGTWGSALEALGKNLASESTRDQLSALIESDYLEAAQFLEDERTARYLERDLVHHFSRQRLEDGWDEIREGAIWLLPDLFPCPVLTTNFDEAIETVYSRRGFAPFPVLDPTSPRLRRRAARMMGTPCAFKLHGTVSGNMTDYDTLVLTGKQYKRHYGEGGDAREALRSFVSTRSLLFLGCSLQKDRTMEVLAEEVAEGADHYAIVSCKEEERDERSRELARLGIRAVFYEDKKYDSVRAVLERLLEESSSSLRGTTPSDGPKPPAPTPDPRGTTPPSRADDKLSNLVERINSRLVRQRRGHPSFRLMNDDPAKELLPWGERQDAGEAIPNAKRRVRTEADGDRIVPFGDFIQNSWESGEQNHLFVVGRGGVGKTVALLTFATEKGFLPKGVPAVYIPLYDLAQYSDLKRDCIGEYLRRSFSEDEAEAVECLSHKPWDGGPNVILLLDGHNEIPATRRADVNEGIRAWAERAGTQLVTTSRVAGLFGVANTRWLELQGLSRPEAKSYLEDRGIEGPGERDDRLWQMLETPLMLRIYADVASLPRALHAKFLRPEPSDCAGHLVWNYLQRELWRLVKFNGGDFCNAEYAAASLLIMPYVCWRMESAHEFKVSRDRLAEYVGDACAYWRDHARPRHFEGVESDLCSFVDWADQRRLAASQRAIVAEETGLLSWNGDGYSLMHQSFRDGLAAIHVEGAMEAAAGTLPDELRQPISEYVKDFLADVANEGLILGTWDANRREDETHTVATYNLVRLAHAHFDGDLMALDWSGMDLRKLSLFPFRRGIRLALSPLPSRFGGMRVDATCFVPQGHTGSVNAVCFSPDGATVASGSTDGTVRLWDAATGRQALALEGHRDWVKSVCFSPDGATVASGSTDGTVRLWDAATGRQSLALEGRGGHTGGVNAVCFSPDGATVASGSDDGTVRLWDAATGRQALALGGTRGPGLVRVLLARRRHGGERLLRRDRAAVGRGDGAAGARAGGAPVLGQVRVLLARRRHGGERLHRRHRAAVGRT